jgi:hypothetical protein
MFEKINKQQPEFFNEILNNISSLFNTLQSNYLFVYFGEKNLNNISRKLSDYCKNNTYTINELLNNPNIGQIIDEMCITFSSELYNNKIDNYNDVSMSPNIMRLIKEKPDLIQTLNWNYVSLNDCAIDLINANLDKVNKILLMYNRSFMITYDYELIAKTKEELHKEFIKWYMRPDNINKWIGDLDL